MLLGPSHFSFLEQCALSSFSAYQTPLGPLAVDTDVISKLSKVKAFRTLHAKEEITEHSLEMHTPVIKQIFKEKSVKIVPILVG